MPKLPSDFVKAPSFDNPLRATGGAGALTERKLMIRLDAATWGALEALSEREDTTPEALMQRALERWLGEAAQAVKPPQTAADPLQPSLRALLIDRLSDEVVRWSWVQRLVSLRGVLRDGRA